MDDIRDALSKALGPGFLLEGELGGGGMSRVFVATEVAVGRKVAVKVIDEAVAAEVNVERFTREITTLGQLHHPNIVPVLSTNRANGILYYTMPYVAGGSLRARLKREPQLPVPVALGIAADVAAALAQAHAQGFVHRDIKPENILLDGDRASLTDFGIARAVSAHMDQRLTATGTSIGSPMYMSPEQASGEHAVDARSDLYSLGCVLFEMLAGEPPFSGPTITSVIAKRLAGPAPSVRVLRTSVSPAVEGLVERALQRTQVDRFQTAQEFLDALKQAEADPYTSASRRTFPTGMTPVAPRRRWGRWVLGAVAGVAVLAGIGFVVAPAPARALVRTLVFRPSARFVPQRVVVAPFENQTGDTAFTPFGAMAADWIAQALARTGRVDVVDARSADLTSRVVKQTPSFLRPSDPSLAVAEELGAGTLVAGSFYRDGDSIRVVARIIDVASRQLTRSIPPVAAPAAAPGRALEGLTRRTVGTLAATTDSTLGASMHSFGSPPSYEAYELLYRGINAYYARDTARAYGALAAAVAADTAWLSPQVLLALFVAEGGNYGPPSWRRADSIVKALQPRLDRASPTERAVLDRLRATLDGDRDGILRASRELVRLSPGTPEFTVTLASAALYDRRPREALRVLQGVDPKRGFNLISDYYWGLTCQAQHQLADYRAQLKAARDGAVQFPDREFPTTCEAQALAALGRLDELRIVLGRRLANPNEAARALVQRRIALLSVRELRVHGHPDEARTLAGELLARTGGNEPDANSVPWHLDRAQLLLQLGRAGEAVAELLPLAARDSVEPVLNGTLGVAAAMAGDSALARRVLARLAALQDPSVRGLSSYAVARIHASLGARDSAMTWLQTAVGRGHAVHYTFAWRSIASHGDEAWLRLERDPEFVALVGPRP